MKPIHSAVCSNAFFIGSTVLLGLTLSLTEAWIVTTSQTNSFTEPYSMYKSVVRAATVASATTDTAVSEIIGNGRIGSLLAEAGNCRVLGRTDTVDPNNADEPIYIATRNDALDGIVENCPINRRSDLVFLQNGYLDDFLDSKGLLNSTQVLLYLSVPSKGAKPIDGITSYNPEGLTMATGIHAAAFAERLLALNMKCNVVEPSVYRPAMFEKLMYDTARLRYLHNDSMNSPLFLLFVCCWSM